MTKLQGKVCLLTGAAHGIGRATAQALAAEGARLLITDIDDTPGEALAEELRASGTEAVYQHHDVSSEADWAAAFETLGGRYGRLDVLVNNAGIEIVKPASETSLEDWRRLMSVNLDGVFLGCKVMEPLLRKAGEKGAPASVINISSIAGLIGFPNQPAYNTSKGGVRHLTKSMAIEWAHFGYNIRVNSIHPGCIRTPMLEQAVEGWVREGSVSSNDPWTAIADLCPMRRVGKPEDIANGALFLASDESAFCTGIELVIDGGWVAR